MNLHENLKERLREIKENNYQASSKEEIQYLIPKMIQNIGNPDAELRDELIYTTFYHWIVNDNITKDELRDLLNTSISDNNLFFHVGEVNSDTVFTRSFSVLLIPLILYIDQKDRFLEDDEILNVYNKLIEYFKLEKDYRGYVEDKGWAHAVAHTADALDEIARYEIIGEDKLIKILVCIREKIAIDEYVYIDEEDERLVIGVYTILKRHVIDVNRIEKWIDSIVESYKKRRIYPEDSMILMNVKGFLRSLYFRIYGDEELKDISIYIKNSLDKIDNYKN